MNVLIVDDHAPWAELCAVMVRGIASKIKIASSYAEALVTLNKPNGYDVVVLDLDLPDSPPKATIERIGEIRGTGRKVVVVTGLNVTEDMRTNMKLHGALDCLYKGSLSLSKELNDACA